MLQKDLNHQFLRRIELRIGGESARVQDIASNFTKTSPQQLGQLDDANHTHPLSEEQIQLTDGTS